MDHRIHLSAFALFSPAPHTPLSWVYPREMIEHFWYEPEYWEDVARTLERGCFDMLFFADGLAGGSTPDQIRYAIQFPCHDPVALVTYLAGIVKRLGFAVTMSTTFYPPYLLTRTLATLDHLTKGRIGWNIVSSVSDAEARGRYDEIRERIPLEASLAQMSMHWNLDCASYDLDQPVAALDVHGTRGLFEMYQKKNPQTTLREIAKTYLTGGDRNPLIGTPAQVADAMVGLLEEGGGNGFQISPPYHAPHYYADLVDSLVPELQRRGLYPDEYRGETLRDHVMD